MRKEDERRLLVTEMSWLMRIKGRSRRERIRNTITRKESGAEVVEKIQKRRLKWFGHVERMDNRRLPMVFMKITHGVRPCMDRSKEREVEGDNEKRGWTDNVKEDLKSKGTDLTMVCETVRDRTLWRNFIRASSSGN